MFTKSTNGKSRHVLEACLKAYIKNRSYNSAQQLASHCNRIERSLSGSQWCRGMGGVESLAGWLLEQKIWVK